MRLFLFMLAGHLRMTVGEIEQRMDSRELSEWLAYHRFFRPLDDSWTQTGIMASASLMPYSRRGHAPKPADFVPLERAPQHKTQMMDVIAQMKRDLEG